MSLSRRSLLGGVAAGAVLAGMPALPGVDWASIARAAEAGAFGYGVASGDPLADRAIIWTRATPLVDGRPALPGSGLGAPLPVRWEVFADAGCTCLVTSGETTAVAESDHTVKVDVTGLHPYTTYYYRFSARGETSPVGRLRTAPDEAGRVHALRFGQVSCANYPAGYFHAYRSLADRDDLDFVLHLGDYIYEYANDSGPFGKAERKAQPDHEAVTLADYRLRYATHHADPDLARCHQRHPFIAIFDDHETANNSWSGGAENHNPVEGEGTYADRKKAGYQAYVEWLPIRITNADPHQGTQFFRRFTYGDLADLSVLETRQNRSQQIGSFVLVGDPVTDAKINDPKRQIMEPEQMSWLKAGLATRRTWHLVGNQVMLSPLAWPGQYIGAVQGTVLANTDAWDGYRYQQKELLAHMSAQPRSNGDTVVLTGDIHSSWVENLRGDPDAQVRSAQTAAARVSAPAAETPRGPAQGRSAGPVDVPDDQDASFPPGIHQRLELAPGPAAPHAQGAPAGVEFVCPSITSDGLYEFIRKVLVSPTLAMAAVKTADPIVHALNPSLRYFDGIRHGYVVIDVTAERVQADYWYTPAPSESLPDPRTRQDASVTYGTSWQTLAGSREATAARGPLGARRDQPYAAQCPAPGATATPAPGGGSSAATGAGNPEGVPAPAGGSAPTAGSTPTGGSTPTAGSTLAGGSTPTGGSTPAGAPAQGVAPMTKDAFGGLAATGDR